MKNIAITISILLFGLNQGCQQENIQESAQWRGANRDGIFHETDLLNHWPDEGPELLWVFEGLGKGFAAAAVTTDGLFINGEHIREVWRNNKIQNNFGGLVVVDGHLFTMVKGNRLVALEPENGAVADSIKVATGSIIYADNKFICYGNNGTINLVSYNQDKLEIAGQLKVKEGTGHHFSHPVLANGIMYIRHGNAMMAYRVK